MCQNSANVVARSAAACLLMAGLVVAGAAEFGGPVSSSAAPDQASGSVTNAAGTVEYKSPLQPLPEKSIPAMSTSVSEEVIVEQAMSRLRGVTNIVFSGGRDWPETNLPPQISVTDPATVQQLLATLQIRPMMWCKCRPDYHVRFQGPSGVVEAGFNDHRFDVSSERGFAVCHMPDKFYEQFWQMAQSNNWPEVPLNKWVRSFTVR